MEEFLDMMVPDSNPPSLPISTLVFMDLEATGLPSFQGRKNVHITEISLVAVDRSAFESDSSFRVLNKLSLCVRPRTLISPGASSITGLYNDILENQEKFDESIPKLFEYFFRRLRRPICLLAHNGNKYDFPLLQAELQNINYCLDPAILCVDTLEAIRFIVPNPIPDKIQIPMQHPSPENLQVHKQDLSHEQNVPQFNGTEQKNEEEKMDQETAKLESNDTVQKNEEKMDQEPTKKVAKLESSSTLQENEEKLDKETDDLLSEDMHLFSEIVEPLDLAKPLTNHMQHIHDVDDRTPPKSKSNDSIIKNPHIKKNHDQTWLPKHQYRSDNPPAAKRRLFQNKKPQKFHYSLEKLYMHYFKEEPPKSHYAEADCIALGKVCQRINKDFLEWIDRNSKPFCEVKAMW